MEKEQSTSNRRIEEIEDRIDQSSDGGNCSGDLTISSGSSSERRRSGMTERLSESLVDDGDDDLLLQGDGREDNVLQFLQALDVHVMGGCRSDERLKPLLKLNVSSGAAEDRLLSHLSQHFEPSEVGLLARCLCAPLVSLRVGKIDKQGTLLCPTSTRPLLMMLRLFIARRGKLNLTLLPTSALRISFIGDDGLSERLATLYTDAQCSSVEIEQIEADKSGRSFALRIPYRKTFYFWCSEKCVLSGVELLNKLSDLLRHKPSLSEVTGISKSRLDGFGVHLRAYLVGSTMTTTHTSTVLSSAPPLSTSVESSESSSAPSKTSRCKHNSNLGAKGSPFYQGSLSPRSSSFKENVTKNSSLKSVSREKFRRRGESYMSCVESIPVTSVGTSDKLGSYDSQDKFPVVSRTPLFPLTSSFLESLKSDTDKSLSSLAGQVPSAALPLLSPYYCWCPSVSSTVQHTTTTMPQPALLYDSESLLSSLLSNNLPSGNPKLVSSPLNLDKVSISSLPPFLPDPLIRFPLSLQTAQPVPTFTPLMCDPIVHIPVIDVCSSGGQGYLVSAGPALPTAIAPVHPNMVSSLMPETNSVVEKGARETLRLLISRSNESNPALMDLLPPVLTIRDEKQNILAVGSRGLYIGARDVGATAQSIAAISISSPSELYGECCEVKRCTSMESAPSGCDHDTSDGTCGGFGHGSSDIGEHRTG